MDNFLENEVKSVEKKILKNGYYVYKPEHTSNLVILCIISLINYSHSMVSNYFLCCGFSSIDNNSVKHLLQFTFYHSYFFFTRRVKVMATNIKTRRPSSPPVEAPVPVYIYELKHYKAMCNTTALKIII